MQSVRFLTRNIASLGTVVEDAASMARKRIDRFRVYRATRRELMRLSDRELSDLGLSRARIADLAREASEQA